MRNRNTVLISGIAVWIVTLVLYLLLCDSLFKLPVCWLAVVFTLISEAVTTAAFAFSFGEPRRVGGAVAALIQTLLTVGLSVAFIVSAALWIPLHLFVGAYLLTQAIVLVLLYVLFAFAQSKAEERAQISGSKQVAARYRTLVQSLLHSPAGKEYAALLNGLDEELRFMDDGVTDPLDETIFTKLQTLANGIGTEGFSVEDAVEDVKDVIRQRNFSVKAQRSDR